MASVIRDLLSGRKDGPGDIVQHTVGNALVLHAAETISAEAQSLALSVVKDADNDVVVLDLSDGVPISSWESMAGVLPRRRRGIRLMACGPHANSAAMAGQWLSERLHRTVIAPDGDLVRGSAGGLFVHSIPGSGWVRFRPGRPPTWDAKRYPTPLWDRAVTDNRASSSTGEIEPLPGGVWIRDVREPDVVAEHRRRLTADVPCHPETMTVLLGCPGTAPLCLDDVVRFWRNLDEDSRARTRFVQYGDLRLPKGETFGQALADLLGTTIVCYTGVPVGAPRRFEVRTVRSDGALGWPPFALELRYAPRAHPNSKAHRPVVLSHRPPLAEAEEVAPRVYWYAPDAVIEVIQSGLWVRSAEEPVNAERVRGMPLDPEGSVLVYDDTIGESAERMWALAEDLAARIDPSVGADSSLFSASALVPGQSAAGLAQASLGEEDSPRPTATGQLSTSPPPATEDLPAPTADTIVIRPVVEPVAEAVPPVATATAAALVRPDVTPETHPAGEPASPPAETPAPQPADRPTPQPAKAPTPQRAAEPAPQPADEPAPRQADPPAPRPAGSPTPPPVLGGATPVAESFVKPVAESFVKTVQDPIATVEPVETTVAEPTRRHAVAGDEAPVQEQRRIPPPTASVPVTDTNAPEVRVQPVPPASASALLPGRPLAEERAWLRRTLSREFDNMASSVARIISEHPGLQASGAVGRDDVLADSVAVRLYLSRRGTGVDVGLRSGSNGPHVPFARCAVSGLSRLPSYRGATIYRTSPTEQEWQHYRTRRLVTNWAFVNTLTGPCESQDGDTDVLVWSMTARRTALLESDGAERVEDRALFLPGTHFKILELQEPSDGGRGAILMREIGAKEIDGDGRVDPDRAPLDDLAIVSLRRSLERWSTAEPTRRVGAGSTGRFGLLPGLDRRAVGEKVSER
ncbi:hypothetical protein [Salinispora pacifica]|uniref:hypothetical protein n=1 Tax=Salinispora pacifica TaxID=351187 RepID=UPI0004801F21|nr:hypothetical protein [Salinispora pacifica]